MDELSLMYLKHLAQDASEGRRMMKEHFHQESIWDEARGCWTDIKTPLPKKVIDDLFDDTKIPEFKISNKSPRIGLNYQAM
jgi:hypothetical protein